MEQSVAGSLSRFTRLAGLRAITASSSPTSSAANIPIWLWTSTVVTYSSPIQATHWHWRRRSSLTSAFTSLRSFNLPHIGQNKILSNNWLGRIYFMTWGGHGSADWLGGLARCASPFRTTRRGTLTKQRKRIANANLFCFIPRLASKLAADIKQKKMSFDIFLLVLWELTDSNGEAEERTPLKIINPCSLNRHLILTPSATLEKRKPHNVRHSFVLSRI